MITHKHKHMFSWNKASCNSKYFNTLGKFLSEIHIPSNTGNYIRPRFTRNMRMCKDIPNKGCKLDNFHSGSKYLQLILGRANITTNCFYNCKNYFALFINKWSMFKNDTLIHYMLNNNYFYKKYNSLPLDPVFPIRIVLSHIDKIKTHKMSKLDSRNFIRKYGYNIVKGKAISNRAIKLITHKYPRLKNKITSSSITSRELCILNQKGLYFYIVKRSDSNNYEPYVFISKLPLSEIKQIYSKSDYMFKYL